MMKKISKILIAIFIMLIVISCAYIYNEKDNKAYAETKHIETGFIDEGGKLKYFVQDGAGGFFVKGWWQYNGKTYHFNDKGFADTGWKKISGINWYFDKNGINCYNPHGKWNEYRGNRYFEYGNGKCAKGMKNINGEKYYFDSEGIMRTGLIKSDGKKYYFKKDGKLVRNFQDEAGYSDNDGIYTPNKWIDLKNGNKAFRLGDGSYVKGCVKINGKKYLFDNNGTYLGKK